MFEVDLPLWFYKASYITGAGLLILPELVALLDKDPGDTITELTRPHIQSNSFLLFMVTALLLWSIYHFVVER